MGNWTRKRDAIGRHNHVVQGASRQVSLARVGAATAGLLGAYLATPFFPLRNVLPEPIDLFDHISNIAPTPALAAAAGILYSGEHGERPAGGGTIWELSTKHAARFKRRILPIAMGAAALGNAFVESQYGAALDVLTTGPAFLDVIYPTAATGVAGLTMWRNRTSALAQQGPELRLPPRN